MAANRILAVEDDADLRRLLSAGLSQEGFDVRVAGTGREGVQAASTWSPELLILDIGLPDADGRDVCQAIRANGISAPAIFLTARDAVSDRLSGFSAGGDDYLTKPFAFAELVARLRSLQRRVIPTDEEPPGALQLDAATHAVIAGEVTVPLTPTEYRIVGALAARPGEVLRRRQLVEAAWPEGAIVHDNTLDVYLGRLRRKLNALPGGVAIETVHGVGYSLRVPR